MTLSEADLATLEKFSRRLLILVDLCRVAELSPRLGVSLTAELARWYRPDFYSEIVPVLKRAGGLGPSDEGASRCFCIGGAQVDGLSRRSHPWHPGIFGCPESPVPADGPAPK